VPTPASPKKSPEKAQTPLKTVADSLALAPEETLTEGTGLKTVADRTVPALPNTNAYTHLLLRERALGPPPKGAVAPPTTTPKKTMPPSPPPADIPSPSASARPGALWDGTASARVERDGGSSTRVEKEPPSRRVSSRKF